MRALRSPKVIVGTLVVLALMLASRLLLPVTMPHITLAPENLAILGPVPFTNTMLALLITDVILIVLAFRVGRNLKMVPGGLQNFFEAVVEFWEGQSEQLIGPKLTRTWLPLVLTVFLLIWFSNYLHFVPGFDSVGILCEPGRCPGEHVAAAYDDHSGYGADEAHQEHTLFAVRWTGGEIGRGIGLIHGEIDHAEAYDDGGGHAEAAVPAADGDAHGLAFVPFLRVPASDLNFTIALALIAFVVIEIVGFRTWGPRYLTKFFHFDFRHGIGKGLLGMFVGLIELISELARIISFAFRLFGNIFAGSVLLLVFVFLVPFFLVLPIYALELFVGLIQAFVFAILILAFITLALSPLHGDDQH